MNLREILDDHPKFHVSGKGESVSYQIAPEVLFYLSGYMDIESSTLETGAGISTVMLALRETLHICITPNQAEIDRIRTYCQKVGISVKRVTFLLGRSQDILPRLAPVDLDLVLIDGDHAFPIPFIDWYYTVDKLRVGGLLVVDDTNIWTGQVLKQFLLAEPEWTLTREFGHTVIFTKFKPVSKQKWWGQQRFVTERSMTGITAKGRPGAQVSEGNL